MTHNQMIQTEVKDSTGKQVLYISLELSNKKWKLTFGDGQRKRERTITSGDLEAFQEEIVKTRKHFKLGEGCEIYSCYESGRDGFWIHRYLESIGIKNIVVDPASIEVNRRKRRAKTDRLDGLKLLTMLIRHWNGERKVWSVVRVPTLAQEDERRPNRERDRLVKERGAHVTRIKSLLVLYGIHAAVGSKFLQLLEEVRAWDGSKLPEHIVQELKREYERIGMLDRQLKQLKEEKKQQLAASPEQLQKVKKLERLRAVGPISSWNLVYEFFGWREFKNVKQVGGAAGLAPMPYSSGDMQIEQGISKAGNRRVRSLMLELAWGWQRLQPSSKLSRWFQSRFGGGGKRMRRIGIVALARKLLIALWQYLEHDIVPEGAIVQKA
ncbi:MAG: IS110 family transposase [Geobacteraceae bacterium]|nr:MAG: IS110 family transposase [Geobacteraceae bacterium]